MDSCLLRWSLEDQATAAGRGGGGGSGRAQMLEQARLAYEAAQGRLMEDGDAVAACLDNVSPHATIIEALKGCERETLLLTSALPADLGRRVLARCGLSPHAPPLETVFGVSWAAALAQVVRRAAEEGRRAQVVTGNLARLERLAEGAAEVLAACQPTPQSTGSCRPQAAMPAAAAAVPDVPTGRGLEQEVASRGVEQERAGGHAATPAVDAGVHEAQGAGGAGPSRRGVALHPGQEGRADAGSSSGRAPLDGCTQPGAACAPGPSSSVAPNVEGAYGPVGMLVGRGADDGEAAACSGEQPSEGQASSVTGRFNGNAETKSQSNWAAAAGRSKLLAEVKSASTCRPALSAAWLEPTAPASPDGAASIGGAGAGGASVGCGTSVGGGGGGEGGSTAAPWSVLRRVHLAEWSCSSMSFRARALSHQPRTSLLSEHQLAEWLGVTHLDVVMDGVAWR